MATPKKAETSKTSMIILASVSILMSVVSVFAACEGILPETPASVISFVCLIVSTLSCIKM